MASWHGNAFWITDPLWGEYISYWWIASNEELLIFLACYPEQAVEHEVDLMVNGNGIKLTGQHCNNVNKVQASKMSISVVYVDSTCITFRVTLNEIKLTHWGRDKMAAIFQKTFSNGFSWMKIYEFWLTFHWSLFLGVQLTIFQHWFRLWLGTDQVTSHYLKQWWLDYRRIYASLGLNELMNVIVNYYELNIWSYTMD